METLKIEGASLPLSSEQDWGKCRILRMELPCSAGAGNVLQFTAKRRASLMVATWLADGDSSGDWYRSRTSQVQLYKQGWEVIHGLMVKEQGISLHFRKNLKAGEEVKLHTRKINPPFILLPAAEEQAAAASTRKYMTAAHSLSLFKPPPPGPAAAAENLAAARRT